jgi:hypothetical protein
VGGIVHVGVLGFSLAAITKDEHSVWVLRGGRCAYVKLISKLAKAKRAWAKVCPSTSVRSDAGLVIVGNRFDARRISRAAASYARTCIALGAKELQGAGGKSKKGVVVFMIMLTLSR